MGRAQERPPEPRDGILDRRARLQINRQERGATLKQRLRGIERLADAGGNLLWPRGIDPPRQLRSLPQIITIWMNNFRGTEKGSVALIVVGREDGSPESSP